MLTPKIQFISLFKLEFDYLNPKYLLSIVSNKPLLQNCFSMGFCFNVSKFEIENRFIVTTSTVFKNTINCALDALFKIGKY